MRLITSIIAGIVIAAVIIGLMNITFDLNEISNSKQPYYPQLNQSMTDMPPWENEHKWNRIGNKIKTCWYHKITKRKICKPNDK